jgi:soluble lytic murein transglycosylase-like protein
MRRLAGAMIGWLVLLAPLAAAASQSDDMRAHYRALQAERQTPATVRAIQRAAGAGDPQAVEVLAWMYVQGRGVSQHLCTALHLYLHADMLGVARARANARLISDSLRRPCRLARGLARRLDEAPAAPVRVPEAIAVLLDREARRTGLEPALLYAVAKVESDFRPQVVSSAGARGVMQIMPATARGVFGVDPDRLFDAATNIQLGARFLAKLIDRYGGVAPALSHYYSGRVRETAGGYAPHPIALAYVARVRDARDSYRAAGF